MTREHAATQLLRLGALRTPEFIAITGWPIASANYVLAKLCAEKRVRRSRRGRYEIREAK